MTWEVEEHEEDRAEFQPLAQQMDAAFKLVKRAVAKSTREHVDLEVQFQRLKDHATELSARIVVLERENTALRQSAHDGEWRARALRAEERLAKIMSCLPLERS